MTFGVLKIADFTLWLGCMICASWCRCMSAAIFLIFEETCFIDAIEFKALVVFVFATRMTCLLSTALKIGEIVEILSVSIVNPRGILVILIEELGKSSSHSILSL